MKSPINEEEMINRFNTYLYILTSSELQDKITFDKSKIQINDYFIDTSNCIDNNYKA